MSEAVKKYANDFPEEIKRAVKGIDSEVRYAIVSLLLRKGEASFTELVKELEIDNKVFSNHVRQLIRGGIVENFVRKGDFREKYSYYRLTPFGYDFVRSLFKSLEPSTEITIWLPAEPEYEVSFEAEFDTKNIRSMETDPSWSGVLDQQVVGSWRT